MKVQPDTEKDYMPFMVNRSLSFSPDAILYANSMNTNWIADKKMQYDFLYGSVRRRKRFDKWMKKEEVDELTVAVVMEFYKDTFCSISIGTFCCNFGTFFTQEINCVFKITSSFS